MFKLIWLIRETVRLHRRCELLETKLDHERERNRAHEDEILSRFVSLHGVVGVEPRQPEIPVKKPVAHQPRDMEEAFKNLSPYHQSLRALYEEEGLAQGMEMGQIHRDFYQEHILGNPRIEMVPQ